MNMINQQFTLELPVIVNVLKQHKVKSAYAFGSVLTERFNDGSDIDLLINFEEGLEPLRTGELWWSLHDTLRSVLNREIDLVMEDSLRNPYFMEELEEKKQLIYAA